MREDGSAIFMCLALFSSHSKSCFVSSLENLCAVTDGEPCPGPLSLGPLFRAGAQTCPLPAQAWELAPTLAPPSWAIDAHSLSRIQRPSGPGPARRGGRREHTACPPRKPGRTGGQVSWALVPALGLSPPKLYSEGLNSTISKETASSDSFRPTGRCPQGVQGQSRSSSAPPVLFTLSVKFTHPSVLLQALSQGSN